MTSNQSGGAPDARETGLHEVTRNHRCEPIQWPRVCPTATCGSGSAPGEGLFSCPALAGLVGDRGRRMSLTMSLLALYLRGAWIEERPLSHVGSLSPGTADARRTM